MIYTEDHNIPLSKGYIQENKNKRKKMFPSRNLKMWLLLENTYLKLCDIVKGQVRPRILVGFVLLYH